MKNYHLLNKKYALLHMKIFVILILPFAGCYDDKIEQVKDVYVSYFPMQPGNRWVYETNNLDLTIEISSSIYLNHNLYHEVLRIYDGESDTIYLRGSIDEKIFINFNRQDYIYVDFLRNEGEIWQSFESFYSKVNKKGLTVQTAAGTFHNVIEIFTDNTQLSDLYEFNRYAPGVGLVESIGFRRTYRLKRAYVNGITYP
ncbi:MAG: hypothetical protein IPM56_16345 [Ignavibacteriales bacterium]|nr:MAG: hypothetical protein IPM56_16345 [Ignavibacteriales bacterium]